MPVGSRHDLFGVDPEEFVAARDQLVRDLRASGDKDEAADVKKLRRPQIPVWALNQLERTDPNALEELLDAAGDARRAQDEVLGGADADVLRAALTRRRKAIVAASKAAGRAIATSGRSADAHVRDVENALNAVVGSARLADDLGRGELTGIDADAGDDGDMLATLVASAGEKPTAPRKQTTEPARPPSRQLVNAREKLEQHRAEAAEAAENARAAETDLQDAEAALKQAERALATARRNRDAAAKAQERADHAVAKSEHAVARLEH